MLREIPEDGVKKLLSSKDALADCDIAIFVHDRSLKCVLSELILVDFSGGLKFLSFYVVL